MADPVTLIISALAGGAAAAGKEVVSQAVKDAYVGLKKLIQSKFESKPMVSATLQTLEKKPKSPDIQGVVETTLLDVGADQDKEIQAQAEQLLAVLEKENLLPKTLYQAKVEGSGAVAQGPGAVATGAGGVAVGGHIQGNVTTGDKDQGKS
ncbi:MAG: hypothetical protein NPIRA04_13400 [Nitrospirales bacterium]|nr:MAG: hypothetical protein NPIRA04_13400 [Nitrospirales bacterium]